MGRNIGAVHVAVAFTIVPMPGSLTSDFRSSNYLLNPKSFLLRFRITSTESILKRTYSYTTDSTLDTKGDKEPANGSQAMPTRN